MDDFENTLRRQPYRRAPVGWRRLILTHAARANEPAKPRAGQFGALRCASWPKPRAWAMLAAAWIAIFILNRLSSPAPDELASGRAAAAFVQASWAFIRHLDEPFTHREVEPPRGLNLPANPPSREGSFRDINAQGRNTV